MDTTGIKKRYAYIDNIKLAACFLVVAGHFFMSMTANGIMPYSTAYYYLLYTVYTFHVPVFFVCSGFLYQKGNRVHSFQSWRGSISRKLLDLGVPYCVFTAITVLLKHVFENEVTSRSGDLLQTLFVHPTAPYWYLYALFFMFVFIPCDKSPKGAVILFGAAVAVKLLIIVLKVNGISPPTLLKEKTGSFALYLMVHIVFYTFSRFVWFAGGMLLAFADESALRRAAKYVLPVSLTGALVLSCFTFHPPYDYDTFPQFFIGVLLVIAVVFAAMAIAPSALNTLSKRFSEYFMPVFVTHTIFSAGIRIALIKLGIDNLALHLLGGIVGGFVLPILVYALCKRITPLMFFFYPTKTIRLMRQKHEQTQRVISEK